MKRVLLVAVWVAGCGGGEALFVRQMLAPEPEACGFSADPAGASLLEGTYDWALAEGMGREQPGYFGAMLVGNRDGEGVAIGELEVEVRSFDGALLSAGRRAAAGFVDPGSDAEPGYAAVGAVLVDPVAIAGVRASAFPDQRVVARVTVHGTTIGGGEAASAPWDYPIHVCEGCLACLEPQSCEDEAAGACRFAQDQPSDCRLVQRSQICPNL